jgi:hypothetical protein
MPNYVTIGATALFAGILCAAPVSLRVSPDGNLSLSLNNATAEIGRPLTATSVAGVHRRQARRAYRRGYYGYGQNYQPYSYGYGTRYGYGTYQPANTGWFGNQTWGSGGYAYQPYNRWGYQQPYYGGYNNQYKQWWQF